MMAYFDVLYRGGVRASGQVWRNARACDTYHRAGERVQPCSRYMLGGTVTVDGQPAVRRVVAYDRLSMSYFAGTWSKPDGTWQIRSLPDYPAMQLLVIAFDDIGTYNAEAADYITLKEQQ